jgi:hypothetical protein
MIQAIKIIKAYESILLTTRTITGMRLQKAPVNELQVCLECANGLSFALWRQSKDKDCGYQDTHEAQSNRELVERVTRDKS